MLSYQHFKSHYSSTWNNAKTMHTDSHSNFEHVRVHCSIHFKRMIILSYFSFANTIRPADVCKTLVTTISTV